MKYLIALLCMMLGSHLVCAQPAKIKRLLPTPLNAFELHKTKLEEVEKALGKAALKEGQNYYWVRGGLKYALKLSFDNNSVLSALDYTFTEKWPDLEKIGKFDPKKILPGPIEGKSGGRFLMYKEKGVELLIDPSTKTIQSVKFK